MNIADFDSILKQYNDGLISWSEFLLAVQLTSEQVEQLVALHKLPQAVYLKIKSTDFD